MSNGILQRMRDALAGAAGQYGPITDEQRNEWLGLVKEFDEHDSWFKVSDAATGGSPVVAAQESEE